MANEIFKTPKSLKYERFYTAVKSTSESQESVSSSGSECANSDSGSDCNLSMIAEFDEIIRFYRSSKEEYVYQEKSYIGFAESAAELLQAAGKWRDECMKIQDRFDLMLKDKSDLEGKLALARRLLDVERRDKKEAEKKKNFLESKLAQMHELLVQNKVPGTENTFRYFDFMDTDRIDQEQAPQLSCIPEINSTGSLLSDLSYSRSEDDLDPVKLQSGNCWKKHRPSTEYAAEQPANKKRKSSGHKVVDINTSDTVRATTTLTMPKHGPITATSVIEALPGPSAPILHNKYPPSAPPPETPESVKSIESYNNFNNEPTLPADMVLQSWARQESPAKPIRTKLGKFESKTGRNNNNNNIYSKKQHVFLRKTVIMPYNCDVCQKKMRFGRSFSKCKDCKNMCHDECKDKVPLPCIPVINTPTQGNGLGVIGDFTGTIPPMVPAIIIHCISEIESRGGDEVGLYRVPGSEREVKMLKERFLKAKAAPSLADVDVHVICGVVKDFLRSLQEPLITKAFWKDFVSAAERDDVSAIKEKIADLPQPNRDTLAYMMLHLQRISEKKAIKMPIQNLSIVFGPTIVGYLSEDLDEKRSRTAFLVESKQQINVMKILLDLPSTYWECFVNVINYERTGLQQTPSTDSLLSRPPRTPNRGPINTPKARRFFPTPPGHKY